jgi:competence protein ComEA
MPRPLLLALLLAWGLALLSANAASAAPPALPASAAKLVDINTASRAELRALPGLGDAEVARIIASRPYLTKTALVEKQVLTLAVYDALRSRIVVVHKRAPSKPKP